MHLRERKWRLRPFQVRRQHLVPGYVPLQDIHPFLVQDRDQHPARGARGVVDIPQVLVRGLDRRLHRGGIVPFPVQSHVHFENCFQFPRQGLD